MKKSLSYFVSAVVFCTALMLPKPEHSQNKLLADDPPIVIIPPIIIRPVTEKNLLKYYQVEFKQAITLSPTGIV